MFAYPNRGGSRKQFSNSINRNHLTGVAAVRRIGPIWIVAGRRPRSIPLFIIQRTMLSPRAAP
jgi:hypothetical protein